MNGARLGVVDTIKGWGVLSVIFIHTAYCSGGGYVPQFMRNISLVFDVSIFFYMTGVVSYLAGGVDPIKQIAKIIRIFIYLFIAYSVLTFDVDFNNLLSVLTLNRPPFTKLEIIGVSYWFIPVYVISLICASILIAMGRRLAIAFIVFSVFYYVLVYFFKLPRLQYAFMGGDINYLLFYSSCILTGFYIIPKFILSENVKCVSLSYLLTCLGCACLFLVLYKFYDSNIFELQLHKFPIGFPCVLVSVFSLSAFILVSRYYSPDVIGYMGKHAIVFYISQGCSSSLMFYLVDYLSNLHGWT